MPKKWASLLSNLESLKLVISTLQNACWCEGISGEGIFLSTLSNKKHTPTWDTLTSAHFLDVTKIGNFNIWNATFSQFPNSHPSFILAAISLIGPFQIRIGQDFNPWRAHGFMGSSLLCFSCQSDVCLSWLLVCSVLDWGCVLCWCCGASVSIWVVVCFLWCSVIDVLLCLTLHVHACVLLMPCCNLLMLQANSTENRQPKEQPTSNTNQRNIPTHTQAKKSNDELSNQINKNHSNKCTHNINNYWTNTCKVLQISNTLKTNKTDSNKQATTNNHIQHCMWWWSTLVNAWAAIQTVRISQNDQALKA